MQAWAQLIRYDIPANKVELIRNAQLDQNGDTFKGERIEYDTVSKIVNASGSAKGGGDGRVKMIIKPQTQLQ